LVTLEEFNYSNGIVFMEIINAYPALAFDFSGVGAGWIRHARAFNSPKLSSTQCTALTKAAGCC